jgi:hypothetical protein
VRSAYFDVISGLAGMAAYLMIREHCDAVVVKILEKLVWLSEIEGKTPRWYTPYELLDLQARSEEYRHGLIDIGLAHGVAGALAMMSIGLKQGYEVRGLEEAVERTAYWLVIHSSPPGLEWGVAIPLTQDLAPGRRRPPTSAWCYGTPGVARAVHLAAAALQNEELFRTATCAMEKDLERTLRSIQRARSGDACDEPDITVCHGLSGNLQVSWRLFRETSDERIREKIERLTLIVLDIYQLHAGAPSTRTPGLLKGEVGILLALLSATSDLHENLGWDRVLALA